MPTGYTQKIIDGEVQTPKDFLHLCLHDFGTLYPIRDIENFNKDYSQEILNFHQKSIDHHQNALDHAKAELEKYQQISDEDLYQEWVKKETKSRDWATEYMKTVTKTNDLLGKFHRSIKDWECSKEYEPVKNFALEQLEISTEDTEYAAGILERTKDLSREHFDTIKDEYRKSMVEAAEWDVKYHTEELEKATCHQSETISYYYFFRQEIEKLK